LKAVPHDPDLPVPPAPVYNPLQLSKERTMHVIRPSRLVIVATLLLGPALLAQVPTASDPAKYLLPPGAVVDVFAADSLPQTTLSPNRQVVALTKARAYPTIAELAQP